MDSSLPFDNLETPVEAPSAAPAAPAAVNQGDKHIWGIYIALCIISMIELYSASSREVASSSMGVFGPIIRHTVMLVGGFVLMWIVSRRHYREFLPWTLLFAAVSAGLMIYVMNYGEYINGARRSVTILGISIQPAEFIKMSSVLLVALFMAKNMKKKSVGVEDKGIIYAAVAILFFSGLLVKQGLTNTMLLMAISISMMLIGGVAIKKMLIVLGIYVVLGGTGYVLMSSSDGENRTGTWQQRIERFADDTPKYEQKIDAKNRQEMYGYMAMANGGVVGVFPGNSRETSRLPLAFSDYIFSIIVEDTGLIGGLFVLVLYLWLLARAAGIAARCSRAYPALLVIGMAVMIVFQALFHMAIVTGVSPVSGQPLPLISKGGSSILITSIAFGVMLSVSRFAVRHNSKKAQIKEEINSLPEEIVAENPTQL